MPLLPGVPTVFGSFPTLLAVLGLGMLLSLILGRLLRGGFGVVVDLLGGLLGAAGGALLLAALWPEATMLALRLGAAGAGALVLTLLLHLRRPATPRVTTASSVGQPTTGGPSSSAGRTVSLGHWLLHLRKNVQLLVVVFRDSRVPFWRKASFVAVVLLFGVVLIIPDSLLIAALAAILPLASPLLGIPTGIIDLAAVVTLTYLLLRFFPRDIVAQHALQLYGPQPDLRPHVLAQPSLPRETDTPRGEP